MKFKLFLLVIIVSFFSCIEKKNKSVFSISHSEEEQNQSSENNSNSNMSFSFDGISTNPNILVQEGKIFLNLKEGVLKTSAGVEIVISKDNKINGTLLLKDAVTKDTLNGITISTNDSLEIKPDKPLNPNIVYLLIFKDTVSKLEYKEKIFIAADNVCNPTSNFSQVPIQKADFGSNEIIDLPIRENLYNDKVLGNVVIVGWDHTISKSFLFKINNRTDGAKYKVVTVYGAYDIPGHECELYLQRDINSPFPTWIDNNYGSKSTKITQEDATIHDLDTKKFYHFGKSFIVLKVFNDSNVDITAKDNGFLSLQQTDSLYGLPLIYNPEEDSSLLAYLNKGNNNSYSMVLGGLIVGIFSFFLSRRLFKKQEEN